MGEGDGASEIEYQGEQHGPREVHTPDAATAAVTEASGEASKDSVQEHLSPYL
jgi:hypothetical protein